MGREHFCALETFKVFAVRGYHHGSQRLPRLSKTSAFVNTIGHEHFCALENFQCSLISLWVADTSISQKVLEFTNTIMGHGNFRALNLLRFSKVFADTIIGANTIIQLACFLTVCLFMDSLAMVPIRKHIPAYPHIYMFWKFLSLSTISQKKRKNKKLQGNIPLFNWKFF